MKHARESDFGPGKAPSDWFWGTIAWKVLPAIGDICEKSQVSIMRVIAGRLMNPAAKAGRELVVKDSEGNAVEVVERGHQIAVSLRIS